MRRYPPELVRFLNSNGVHKVMFGTNHPMITPVKCLAALDDLKLTEETKAAFLGATAARVFKL